MKAGFGIAFAVALGAAAGYAESLTLFDARQAGPDVWSWGGAKAEAQGGKLVVTEHNPEGAFGDAYVTDRLPYFPEGVVELEVDSVASGAYTLQGIAFVGTSVAGTADLLKSSTATGIQRLPLSGAGFGAETESVLLKLWAVDAEGASFTVNNITYSTELAPEKILLTEPFTDVGGWKGDAATLLVSPQGGQLTLDAGASVGSILLAGRRVRSDEDRLLIGVKEMRNGTITVQFPAFDAEGNYVESVEVVKNAQAGWHGAVLRNVRWPEGAAQYEIKIWIGGQPGARATFDKLYIFKP